MIAYFCWKDVEISEFGVRQSVELKGKIKDKHFDVVFCSDLKRAVDSARLIFEGKVPIIEDARLRECNYGQFNAKPSAVVEPMQEKAITERFSGGESYEDVKTRVADFLAFLKKNYNGKIVAICYSASVPSISRKSADMMRMMMVRSSGGCLSRR